MADNKWNQPANPPAPLFTGDKETRFVKQITDEIIERVISQPIVYYPISIEHTNFHSLYGEAIEKTFLPPVHVHVLIEWEGLKDIYSEGLGIDKITEFTAHFHKKRLTLDKNLVVKAGDFVFFNNFYYQIVKTGEPKLLWGQQNESIEISAKCIRARESLFNAK
jgi:hypothetical protein